MNDKQSLFRFLFPGSDLRKAFLDIPVFYRHAVTVKITICQQEHYVYQRPDENTTERYQHEKAGEISPTVKTMKSTNKDNVADDGKCQAC